MKSPISQRNTDSPNIHHVYFMELLNNLNIQDSIVALPQALSKGRHDIALFQEKTRFAICLLCSLLLWEGSICNTL